MICDSKKPDIPAGEATCVLGAIGHLSVRAHPCWYLSPFRLEFNHDDGCSVTSVGNSVAVYNMASVMHYRYGLIQYSDCIACAVNKNIDTV